MTADGHPIFAWFFDLLGPRADASGTAVHRRALLSAAAGRVLEVGAGTGLNLPHFPPAVVEALAVEPDPFMIRRLARAVRTTSMPVHVVRARAEALPLEDGRADAVVCSLVLCSVQDQAAALSEVRRVLAPGGRLLFFEHVRSDDRRFARRQDLVERVWGWFAAGCHPNRDSVGAIRAAGFEIERIERWNEQRSLFAKPHVLGEARMAR